MAGGWVSTRQRRPLVHPPTFAPPEGSPGLSKPTCPPAIEIRDNPGQSRYEAWLEGELVGIMEYTLAPGVITIPHTEVLPHHEGKGIGSALVQYGLDDIRARGERRVIPQCPFVKVWIQRHRDYASLLADPPSRP